MPSETFYHLPAEKQASIISAAVDEFYSTPYAAASISAIVRAAEIAKGSFYQYFNDKKDLYLYVLKLGMAKKLALVKTLPVNAASLKTFDYLKWMLQASVQFELTHPQYARIAYRAFVEEIPFADEVEAISKQGGASYFNEFLSQGVLHDDVAPWVDIDMAAYFLQTLYITFGRYFLRRIQVDQNFTPTDLNDYFANPSAQMLFDNLMELVEAGMGRDPEIRKHFFPK